MTEQIACGVNDSDVNKLKCLHIDKVYHEHIAVFFNGQFGKLNNFKETILASDKLIIVLDSILHLSCLF